MKNCKGCTFSECKNSEYVYCKNFEKNVNAKEVCGKYIMNTIIDNVNNYSVKK